MEIIFIFNRPQGRSQVVSNIITSPVELNKYLCENKSNTEVTYYLYYKMQEFS